MTNCEKYLKEEVDIKEFSRNMYNYLVNRDEPLKIKIENFLQEDIKLTLTEDERCILRNIDGHSFEDIRRARNGFLELYDECLNVWTECQFKDDLFQFIKERRRILYCGTFERRIKCQYLKN